MNAMNIGMSAIRNGGVDVEITMMTESKLRRLDRRDLMLNGITFSMAFMSFVNRFRMRPVGVDS